STPREGRRRTRATWPPGTAGSVGCHSDGPPGRSSRWPTPPSPAPRQPQRRRLERRATHRRALFPCQPPAIPAARRAAPGSRSNGLELDEQLAVLNGLARLRDQVAHDPRTRSADVMAHPQHLHVPEWIALLDTAPRTEALRVGEIPYRRRHDASG